MAHTLWEASGWGRSRPELRSSRWLWTRERRNCRHRFSVDLGNKAALGREEGTKTGNQLSSQSRVMARVRQ